MAKYCVLVREVLSRPVYVEASNAKAAKKLVQKHYNQTHIVLDWNDLEDEAEFIPSLAENDSSPIQYIEGAD